MTPTSERLPDGIASLIWMGVRTEHFEETVAFYREVMGLTLVREGAGFAWFVLANGVELHVYGPADEDHRFFGVGPVVGFEVADFAAARSRMVAAGIEFIGEVQESETRIWNHFRGTDNNIYEIMSKKESPAERME
jgi:catechol 2,3-dioxygenase-like lactoylglutathione lyase family enzyme